MIYYSKRWKIFLFYSSIFCCGVFTHLNSYTSYHCETSVYIIHHLHFQYRYQTNSFYAFSNWFFWRWKNWTKDLKIVEISLNHKRIIFKTRKLFWSKNVLKPKFQISKWINSNGQCVDTWKIYIKNICQIFC